MKIEYLGHAGFFVETDSALILMDPWMSENGALDASWFQYPSNHHLAGPLVEKVRASSKEKILFISHEHRDHFDEEFLRRLPLEEFRIFAPKFTHGRLPTLLGVLPFRERIYFHDREKISFVDGDFEFFIEDSGLDRDSAIFIKSDGSSFLNVNDCKLADRFRTFRKEHGPIDVFAGQFSGATWHPTCYAYSPEDYRRISAEKIRNKFEMIAVSIETLEPRFFLGSAGPPCFLDPELWRINFEDDSIFPGLDAVRAFLDERLEGSSVQWPGIYPGDVFDVATGQFLVRAPAPFGPTPEGKLKYLRDYQARSQVFFDRLRVLADSAEPERILEKLGEELARKLAALRLRNRINGPLFVGVSELPNDWLKVDFASGKISRIRNVSNLSAIESVFYSIQSPAWQMGRVVDHVISWEEFSATFRVRLERHPDQYQTLLNAYVFLEAEELADFCDKFERIEARSDRIILTVGGCQYEVSRNCPHQGADLKNAWVEGDRYLVCPKHQWKFDLESGGICTTNASTLNAVKV
jgi:UDP-MurNAc hydroxylase